MNRENQDKDLILEFSENDDAMPSPPPKRDKQEDTDTDGGIKKSDISDIDEYEDKMIAIAKSGRGSSLKAENIGMRTQVHSSRTVAKKQDSVSSGNSYANVINAHPNVKNGNTGRVAKKISNVNGQSRNSNRVSDEFPIHRRQIDTPQRGRTNISQNSDGNSVTRVMPISQIHAVPAENRRVSNRLPKKGRKKNKKGGYNGTALPSVLKAIIYIIFVLIVSGCLGYFGVVMGNDVFALVKSDEQIEVTIGENTSIDELAAQLKEQKVIRFPYIFKLYAMLRHDDSEFVAGTYTVSPSMNYDILRNSFQEQPAVVTTLSITIPEGYTVDQIIDLMVENGLGTKEKYIEAIQNYEFDYWFINELTVKEGRKYRLEGYLYPDTYYFFSNASEVQVLYKLLDRFDEIFPEEYKTECLEMGWSVDDIVCLASMIQMEAKYEKEYGDISSVFHNRLNNVYYETQGYLQSDATTQYALDERKSDLSGLDNDIDSPYNTYKNKGLPPGPIANPSFSAITWALYPNDTNYFYFVAKPDGYSLFATNATDHAHNIITARGTG